MELDPTWTFPTALDRRIQEQGKDIVPRFYPLERALQAFAQEFSEYAAGSTVPHPELGPVVVFRPRTSAPDGAPERITGFSRLKGRAAPEAISDAFGRLRYLDGETTNRAPRLCGFIGVPPHLIAQAKRINLQKDALRQAFWALGDRGKHQGRQTTAKVRVRSVQTGEYVLESRALTTIALARLGLSDVNLLAAYRHIPLIDEPVATLRFMVARARSVRQISIERARTLLRERGGPFSAEDLARLDRLDPGETLSAPKANTYDRLLYRAVLRARDGNGHKVPKEGPAELPLLLPIPGDGIAPDWSDPQVARERASVPSRMEPEPYLRGLDYYRLTADERRRRKERADKARRAPAR